MNWIRIQQELHKVFMETFCACDGALDQDIERVLRGIEQSEKVLKDLRDTILEERSVE